MKCPKCKSEMRRLSNPDVAGIYCCFNCSYAKGYEAQNDPEAGSSHKAKYKKSSSKPN